MRDIPTGLGDTTDILDEFTVAGNQALVVSTDGRSDEFSEKGEIVLINGAHGGELENDRDSSSERRVVRILKLGFKVRINEVLR